MGNGEVSPGMSDRKNILRSFAALKDDIALAREGDVLKQSSRVVDDGEVPEIFRVHGVVRTCSRTVIKLAESGGFHGNARRA